MSDQRPTVLIIDNDDGVVAAIRTRLEQYGYDCLTGQTGAQGLSEFDDRVVDLVITDLNMPILDGVGVIRKVRAVSDVPIIVITGYQTEFSGALKFIDSVNVLPKPFRADDLLNLVDAEVYIRRMRKKREADYQNATRNAA